MCAQVNMTTSETLDRDEYLVILPGATCSSGPTLDALSARPSPLTCRLPFRLALSLFP